MELQEIFELQKKAKALKGEQKVELLLSLLQEARRQYHAKLDGKWEQSVFALILSDLCNHFIEEQNFTATEPYYQEFAQIEPMESNAWVEKKKSFFAKKLNVTHEQIKKANDLSKAGDHREALSILQNLSQTGEWSESDDETYGWVIYRDLKEKIAKISLDELRKILFHYLKLKNKRPSLLHSLILSLALRYSGEPGFQTFYKFLQQWDTRLFREEDWQTQKNEGVLYSALAVKALKKAFATIPESELEKHVSWLMPLYEKAIQQSLADEGLLRGKAKMHLINHEKEIAFAIYRQLLLEVSNKYYIWHEMAKYFVDEYKVKIGMFAKVLMLEKNEDYLGNVRLDFAEALIAEGLRGEARYTLDRYQKHRESKGWKISEIYHKLYAQTQGVPPKNLEAHNFLAMAEEFAYANIPWVDFMLVDQWTTPEQKVILLFVDENNLELKVSKNRFAIFKQYDIGQMVQFKVHQKEGRLLPLLVREAPQDKPSFAKEINAFITYINRAKNIVHAVMPDYREIMFPQTKDKYREKEFIQAKLYIRQNTNKMKLNMHVFEIKRVSRDEVLSFFNNAIAIVDHVNPIKKLFHFKVNTSVQGILRLIDTDMRPQLNEKIKVWFVTKRDKTNLLRTIVVHAEKATEES